MICPILTSIGAFAIVLLFALAACYFMPGDNGGGVPYYPDKPVQKPTAMNIIPSVPIRGDHDALWSVFYTEQSGEGTGGTEPFDDGPFIDIPDSHKSAPQQDQKP